MNARRLQQSGRKRKAKRPQKAKAKVAGGESENRRKPHRPEGRKPEITMSRKYLIETYGCQMNVHDSERMAGLLEQAGYEPTDDAADADVVVINTCSVREHAEEKLYTRLGELRVLAQEHGHNPIVAVAGCVAQQEGESLLRRSPGVADVIVGTQAIERLPMLVERAAGVAAAGHRPGPLRGCHVPPGRHPSGRPGKGVHHHHRRLQRVLQLLRRAVYAWKRTHAAAGATFWRKCAKQPRAAGAKFSSWGKSSTTMRRRTNPRATSPALVEQIHAIEGIDRIRFASPHPRHFSAAFPRSDAATARRLPAPAPAGSIRIDASPRGMRRRYTRESYLELVDAFATCFPTWRCRPT